MQNVNYWQKSKVKDFLCNHIINHSRIPSIFFHSNCKGEFITVPPNITHTVYSAVKKFLVFCILYFCTEVFVITGNGSFASLWRTSCIFGLLHFVRQVVFKLFLD